MFSNEVSVLSDTRSYSFKIEATIPKIIISPDDIFENKGINSSFKNLSSQEKYGIIEER